MSANPKPKEQSHATYATATRRPRFPLSSNLIDIAMGAMQHLLHHIMRIVIVALLIALVLGNPPKFSPRKVALLHMYDGAPFFDKLGAITLANKRRYATRHGYEFVSHTPKGSEGIWKVTETKPPCKSPLQEREGSCYRSDSGFAIDRRATTFGKIKLALAACHGRDGYWFLWSDADAMIVNQTVPLESVIDDAYDVIVSTDWLMINAGVMLFKCSKWARGFLGRVYAAREFDEARALDQSAFQHFFDTEEGVKEHVKYVPKHAINVYVEEYRAGDFILHMAGKLYEATTEGAVAIAKQFDVLSEVDDVDDVDAFFRSQYVLNYYSGVCNDTDSNDSDCKPTDARRVRLEEPLGAMASPNRYRHVGLRYYWLSNWNDKFDVPGWNDGRVVFDPSGIFGTEIGANEQDSSHDEL